MLYLGTSPVPVVVEYLDAGRIGLMVSPAGGAPPRKGWTYAADNGCFSDAWDPDRWREWLARPRHRAGCLFAAVPDVVGDAAATLERWHEYAGTVRALGYRPAFVLQDGITSELVPWDECPVVFVGGTDEFKGSETAFELAIEARARGRHVHVGRINGWARYAAWASFGDTCDGTFLSFGPDTNIERLIGWLDRHERSPQLWAT